MLGLGSICQGWEFGSWELCTEAGGHARIGWKCELDWLVVLKLQVGSDLYGLKLGVY